MGVFLLIFLVLVATKKIKLDNVFSFIGKLYLGIVGISIFFALFLGGLISLAYSPLSTVIIFGILAVLFKNYKNKKKEEKKSKEEGWHATSWDKENKNESAYQQYSMPLKHTTSLPSSVKGRKKILDKFNKLYNLTLTPEHIQCIVNSTYMSEIWRSELEAMNVQYNSVYEWMTGPTNWLRVYIHAFSIQEISSDMRQQESMAMYAFESVFKYADELNVDSNEELIRRVNEKFLTYFDDASFMIAYRFLESKGLKHNLGKGQVIRNDSEIDKLLNEYKDKEMPKNEGTTGQM